MDDLKEYRCTRNALYAHHCIGHDDLTARQGHYIRANSIEEAWQKMALKFPEETQAGFTVEGWESFNVRIVEVTVLPDASSAFLSSSSTVRETLSR